MWKSVQTWQLQCSKEQFFNAIQVWITKAHTVNRRLIGTTLVKSFKNKLLDDNDMLRIVGELQQGNLDCFPVKTSDDCDVDIIVRDLVPKQLGRFHTARELIIKDVSQSCVSFHPVLHLSEEEQVIHEDKTLGYKLQYDQQNKCLCLCVTKDSEEPVCNTLGVSEHWLQNVLVPKLLLWAKVKDLDTQVNSLKLVPIEKYTLKYQRLKEEYGKELVKNWPERTDPHKFVYEDVAIAAYLLLLWEEERQVKGLTKKQSFVDLGCGNGLLVHLLTKEGHSGFGIDIRKRKIWDFYGADTCLREDSITPHKLFPESDWLLGNHSDELTPWIPVLASRSSRSCNFFVLPCCLWDFMSKFSGKYQGISQYRAYLNYVQEIIEVCGYKPEEDMLRIPSTKRICFIGQTRLYAVDRWPARNQLIEDFIKAHCPVDIPEKQLLSEKPHSSGDQSNSSESDSTCDIHCEGSQAKRLKVHNSGSISNLTSAENGNHSSSNVNTFTNQGGQDSIGGTEGRISGELNSSGKTNAMKGEGFRPRQFKDELRNHCLSVDDAVRKKIVQTVFSALLGATSETITVPGRETQWRKGGRKALSEIVKLFTKEDLVELKNECGGLQTLLRNHHHIFLVQAGCVELRDWTQMSAHDKHQFSKKKKKGQHLKASSTTQLRKTKMCYFHENHPDGCPINAELCRFAHGACDLRTKDS